MNMESKEASKAAEHKESREVVTQNGTRRKAMFLAGGILLILLITIIAGVIVFGGSDRKYQEQLDLGAKYLEEMDYERALVAFNTALEIDPMSVDAYLGMAQTYEGMEDYDAAILVLEQGYEKTGSARLLEELESLKSTTVQSTTVQRLRPVAGEVIIPYSMDESTFFKTLNIYRYNPATYIKADVGEPVVAVANGTVTDIFENEEIGCALTIDLADGYQVSYGMLQNIKVNEGDMVTVGTTIAEVSAPTKCYELEGSCLYFQVTKDGMPVNPEDFFDESE